MEFEGGGFGIRKNSFRQFWISAYYTIFYKRRYAATWNSMPAPIPNSSHQITLVKFGQSPSRFDLISKRLHNYPEISPQFDRLYRSAVLADFPTKSATKNLPSSICQIFTSVLQNHITSPSRRPSVYPRFAYKIPRGRHVSNQSTKFVATISAQPSASYGPPGGVGSVYVIFELTEEPEPTT